MLGSHLRTAVAALCMVVTGSLLASCANGKDSGQDSVSVVASTATQPNIVYVLTDDLSNNLVSHMPHVKQMQTNGMTFNNFFVTDSLCCPSRSSIFTGRYPHNTGVFTNTAPDGGFGVFKKNGNEQKSFAPAMQSLGYRTGFMGKYLNQYQPADKQGTSSPYVPPGWNDWHVAGNGYPEFNYNLNENGTVNHYGTDASDYLTDVLSRKATNFINTSADANKPFMLEIATFAPHSPATPAPRDKDLFPKLKAPRGASFNVATTNPPPWQEGLPPLTDKEKTTINQKYRKRARSIQAVDAMIGHLQDALQAKGVAGNTYFVFGSDNGLHLGQHRLRSGKQTAYDHDIKVPLVVTGPGVPAGKLLKRLTENVDMKPTFLKLAGGTIPSSVDGRSLAGLLHGQTVTSWRKAVLIEHHQPTTTLDDPDAATLMGGDPPSYEAIRTPSALYVEYAGGAREYYDLATDPAEIHNTWGSVPADTRTQLHNTLTALKNCQGTTGCHTASRS